MHARTFTSSPRAAFHSSHSDFNRNRIHANIIFAFAQPLALTRSTVTLLQHGIGEPDFHSILTAHPSHILQTRAAARRPPSEVAQIFEIKTQCDFASLLQAAMAREDDRVLLHDDEDDLDGWELEDESDAQVIESPLSSLPSSRSSSPEPPTFDSNPVTTSQESPARRRTRRGGGKKRKRSERSKARGKEYAKKRKAEER